MFKNGGKRKFQTKIMMEHVWILGLLFFTTLIIVQIVLICQKSVRPPLLPLNLQHQALRTLIVLGSGGHTTELLQIVKALNLQQYAPRHYIFGSNDHLSLLKAQEVESQFFKDCEFSKQDKEAINKSLQISHYSQIHQSCKLGQLNATSIFKTLKTFVEVVNEVLRIQPDVILCNGPGFCFPICVVGFLLKVIGWRWVVVVYVESIARVKTLSRTGFLLYHLRLVDQIFVQWPNLKAKYPRAKLCERIL